MIHLSRKNIQLTIAEGNIPSQGSSDISVYVEEDETYADYYKQLYCGYMQDCQYRKIMLIKKEDKWLLPLEAFKSQGNINVCMAMVKENEKIVTNEVTFNVKSSPAGTTIFPLEQTWEKHVDDYVESLFDDYNEETIKPILEEVNNATSLINEKLENGDFIPNITIEAETVGSDVEAEVIKSGTNIAPIFTFKIPQGETGPMGPQGPAGEGGGQSYMPPLNLNADFQISQRDENPYIGKSSPHMTLDTWELYTPGANPQQVYIEPLLDGGIMFSSYRGAGENATISQTLYFIPDNTIIKYELVAHIYIESMTTNVTFSHGDKVTNLKQGLNLIEFIADSNSKNIFIDLIGTGNVAIKHCRIYPSTYKGESYKEDYDIALIRCQQYLVCLKNRTAGNGYRFLGMVKKTSATAGDFFIPLPTKMVGTPTISMKSVVIRGSTTITSFKNINEMGNGISGTVETVSGDSSIMSFIMIDSSDGYLDISCE